jgi:septum formation protein
MSSPRRPERSAGERRSEATAGGEGIRTLTLASRSPQRRAILAQLGIPFRVEAADVEEIASGDPRELVVENARRKAGAVSAPLALGVDTTVVLDGQPHGKPADREEAERTLRRLSGRAHEVWSGIALRDGVRLATATARTTVRFRTLSDPELEWYLDSEEWRDRAGGYAIQGRGAALVDGIEGDFWNVVGLPVAELLRLAPHLLTGGSQGSQGRSRPLGGRPDVR